LRSRVSPWNIPPQMHSQLPSSVKGRCLCNALMQAVPAPPPDRASDFPSSVSTVPARPAPVPAGPVDDSSRAPPRQSSMAACRPTPDSHSHSLLAIPWQGENQAETPARHIHVRLYIPASSGSLPQATLAAPPTAQPATPNTRAAEEPREWASRPVPYPRSCRRVCLVLRPVPLPGRPGYSCRSCGGGTPPRAPRARRTGGCRPPPRRRRCLLLRRRLGNGLGMEWDCRWLKPSLW
jgi:hypothetical protein